MKGFRFTLIMIILLNFPVLGEAQQNEVGGALLFESKSFDFGIIEEAAGPVSHSFAFVNTGGRDVFLAYVTPSCSCTTAGYDSGTIHPGEAGEITVTYDPAMLPGQFRQNVLVRVSDKSSVRLYIEGVVKERDKGIDEQYPYFLSKGLQSDVLKVRFGFVAQGERMEKRFALVNTSDREMSLSWSTGFPDPGLKVQMPSSLKPGQEGTVVLAYEIEKGRTGTLDNEFTVSVAGSADSKPIMLEGFAVYTTRGSAHSAALRFAPTVLEFGRLRKWSEAVLFNDGEQDLRILDIETSDGVSAALAKGTVIRGGESLKVKVRMDRKAFQGAKGYVRLFTNDPVRPVREIIVKNNL